MSFAHSALFDEDFDFAPGSRPDAANASGAPSEAERADGEADRARAYAEGLRDGRQQQEGEHAEAIHRLLAACETELRATGQEAQRIASESADALGQLMVRILATLLPASCARMGGVEIAAFAREILPSLVREPEVAVHLNPAHATLFEEVLEQMPPELSDRLTVQPSVTVAPGDIRIVWADGRAIRSTAAAWDAISGVLGQFGLLATGDLPAGQFAALLREGA
jgi:flagellar biosynthesis/type III secretory pathway protein FliH